MLVMLKILQARLQQYVNCELPDVQAGFSDFSQFELRLAAVLADDKNLIGDFNKGIDIHTKTASEAFNIPMDKVTKSQRRAAKVINFGILYGMSVRGLSEAANMPYADAKAFIDSYFELRAPIKKKLEEKIGRASCRERV